MIPIFMRFFSHIALYIGGDNGIHTTDKESVETVL